MRILLIAYEFPPGPSPQSLRWSRLARELVRHGAQVHVLTVQRDGERVRLPAPAGLVIHRTPPGAASALIAHLRSQLAIEHTDSAPASGGGNAGPTSPEPVVAAVLNWKGRTVERMNRIAGAFTFPDAFGQWEIGARPLLRQLLEQLGPDLVISSHEPATTLRLGLAAHQLGFRWMADLGDPVLSTYTPARWRRRASTVEASTCLCADHITVTTAATRDLLVARHGADAARISVVPQGYDRQDAGAASVGLPLQFEPDLLELVYTGSFYAFRRPRSLAEAVLGCDGARLTIASRSPPEWLVEMAALRPDKVRMAGFLSHSQALALQRGADVLVNIANDDQVQIPGKLFEYLGASRPILHISGSSDAAGGVLQKRRRALVVPDRTDALAQALHQLLAIKRAFAWEAHFDLRPDLFPEYEWACIGDRLFDIVRTLVSQPRR